MDAILNSITSLFTAAMGWAGDVLDLIVSTPLLLIFATLSLVGLGIGIVRRLMSIR